MNKRTLIFLASAMLLFSSISTNAIADDAIVTGNAGILSDYIFRGIHQSSGTGNGGLDFEYMGFYAGTWLADVEDGIEYDLYAGYVYEFENGLYLGVGYTSYQYSDTFDDEYNEVNLYAGGSIGDVSIDIEYTTGEYNGEFTNDDGLVEGDEYDFIAVTVGYGGVFVTYGDWGDDADDAGGNYIEAGYSMELGGFEVTGAVVHTMDSQLVGSDNNNETEAYVAIHWNFDVI